MYHVEFSRAGWALETTYDCGTLAEAKEIATELIDDLLGRADGYIAIYDGDEPDALWILNDAADGRFVSCDLDLIG